MRKLTFSEVAAVVGGNGQPIPAHLVEKAFERFEGGHASGKGLSVATTRPDPGR